MEGWNGVAYFILFSGGSQGWVQVEVLITTCGPQICIMCVSASRSHLASNLVSTKSLLSTALFDQLKVQPNPQSQCFADVCEDLETTVHTNITSISMMCRTYLCRSCTQEEDGAAFSFWLGFYFCGTHQLDLHWCWAANGFVPSWWVADSCSDSWPLDVWFVSSQQIWIR